MTIYQVISCANIIQLRKLASTTDGMPNWEVITADEEEYTAFRRSHTLTLLSKIPWNDEFESVTMFYVE